MYPEEKGEIITPINELIGNINIFCLVIQCLYHSQVTLPMFKVDISCFYQKTQTHTNSKRQRSVILFHCKGTGVCNYHSYSCDGNCKSRLTPILTHNSSSSQYPFIHHSVHPSICHLFTSHLSLMDPQSSIKV